MHFTRKRFSFKRIRGHPCLALCQRTETDMVQTQVSLSLHGRLRPPFPLTNESYEGKLFPEPIAVFLSSGLFFCCKVNKVLQEFLENLQRYEEKKTTKKASNLLSMMACFQASERLLGAESRLYLSKSELLCRFSQHRRAGSF